MHYRLGIDDIIRAILKYFVVFSETKRNLPKIAAKCACKIATMPSIPSLAMHMINRGLKIEALDKSRPLR
jgi:hypothetical protein